MKKFIYSLFIFILSATTYAGVYTTQYFGVTADVAKDNVIHYEEKINVDFNRPAYGIFRTIQLKGNLRYKLDGRVVDDFRDNRIDNINVNTKFFVDVREGGGAKIAMVKMGDPEAGKITGKHDYKLTYDYTVFSKQSTNYEIMFLVILPWGWSTEIDLFTARVILPKKVDINNLKLFQGSDIYSDNKIKLANIKNLPDGRMIIDVRLENVPELSGLTLFAKLPKDYFEVSSRR